MDYVKGAKMLGARLRAGVRIGHRIELLGHPVQGSELREGDVGVVVGFSEEGRLVVEWHRGFLEEIDPATVPFLVARTPGP